jgi:2-keto-3-deoxy-6-phosphogluconate aldolase
VGLAVEGDAVVADGEDAAELSLLDPQAATSMAAAAAATNRPRALVIAGSVQRSMVTWWPIPIIEPPSSRRQ